MEQHKEKPLLKMLIKALISADQCQNKIQMGNFKFEGVEIHLGLSPSVSLHLKPRPNN
jgi:hypothetical protein